MPGWGRISGMQRGAEAEMERRYIRVRSALLDHYLCAICERLSPLFFPSFSLSFSLFLFLSLFSLSFSPFYYLSLSFLSPTMRSILYEREEMRNISKVRRGGLENALDLRQRKPC